MLTGICLSGRVLVLGEQSGWGAPWQKASVVLSLHSAVPLQSLESLLKARPVASYQKRDRQIINKTQQHQPLTFVVPQKDLNLWDLPDIPLLDSS